MKLQKVETNQNDSVSNGWKIASAKSGRPSLVRSDGRWCESRYSPEVDARRRVEKNGVMKGETVLLVGMGAGELPRAILDVIDKEGRLAVVEPVAEILETVADNETAGNFLNDSRVVTLAFDPKKNAGKIKIQENKQIIICNTPNEFNAGILELLKNYEPNRFIINPSVEWPEKLSALKELFSDLEVRMKSSLHQEDLLKKNKSINRERFLSAPGVSELRNLLDGSDAVIAGGGPSLEKIAKIIGNNADWIATSRALLPLHFLGITPHLAVTTDPQEEIARHFIFPDNSVIPPAVVFPTVSPHTLNAVPQIISAFAEGDGGKRMKTLREEIGELPAGGSVITSAVGLAVLMGAKRIFLAGADFAEPMMKTHVKGTSMELSRAAVLGRFSTLENFGILGERFLCSKGERSFAKSVGGESIPTRKNLMIYARAIQRLAKKYSHITFFQLSKDAVELDGIEYVKADEVSFIRSNILLPSGKRMRKNGELYEDR